MTIRSNRPLDGLRYYIRTFGCQMNENDSERLAGILDRLGAAPAPAPENGDILIANTCAVRKKSVDKMASLLGRWKRFKQERDVIIGVTGCVAQLERKRLMTGRPFLDFVIGPDNYIRLADVLEECRSAPCLETQWSRKWHEIGEIHRARPSSAYVTVMEGCDNFCAYCVVPFTRGREKYRPSQNILREVRDLAEGGCREIQLLGQNVNSYRSPEAGENFSKLLARVDRIEGPGWIRFITSHPRDFTRELAETVARSRRICKQIHLPVQAGSDNVLNRMGRGYTRKDYLSRIAILRDLMPDISLSTDIIVGFPGETEDDFLQTLEVLEQVRYTNIFSFQYSPRPRTRALRYTDDVPPGEKRDRLLRVQALQKRIQLETHTEQMGRTYRVLGTGKSRKDAGISAGRNEASQVINFASGKDVAGEFVTVRVTGFGPYSLRGELLSRD